MLFHQNLYLISLTGFWICRLFFISYCRILLCIEIKGNTSLKWFKQFIYKQYPIKSWKNHRSSDTDRLKWKTMKKKRKKFKFLAFQIFGKFRYFVEHLKLASFCTKLILTNFVKNMFVGRQLVLYSFFPLIYIGLNNLYLKIAFGKYSF